VTRKHYAQLSVRLGLPLLLLIAGIVLLVIPGTAALGIALVVIAPLVWIANLLMRLGLSSQDDRDREQAARQFYTREHRWPDEPS
jgi:UPF0716 family protein affecting phage T7 exclusion